MVIFANGSSVAVPLTVAAAGGFVGRVSDLYLPFRREEEYMGAHRFALICCV